MIVKTLLNVCSSGCVQILSTDETNGFRTYAYVDYFISKQDGLYYPTATQLPESIKNMRVDFFIDSMIFSADGTLRNGVRIYVK